MAISCLSVYDEILKWSKERPVWQRDALRRMVVNGSLGEKDIDELLRLCKIIHGIKEPSEGEAVPVPLDEGHICPEETAGESARLISISNVTNVNAINSASPLTFSESGLTIIYGNNGAGKSGYVRILKNVCRARHVDKRILPNVFLTSSGTPSAQIAFRHGTSECFFDWEKDKNGPAELVCVNVFDSNCASIYVNEENKIAYMPLGLDVFDKLSKACDTIKAKLLLEKGSLGSKLETVPWDYEGTHAEEWYTSISIRTKKEDIEKYTSFSEEETKRLDELQRVLFEDSKKKRLAELRTKKERYSQLSKRLEEISVDLSPENVDSLKKAKQEFDTAVKAAELASKAAFEAEPLKGVGSDAWQELWMAAKKFSETKAYPGEEFPNTGPNSKCVLCLQDLDEEAKDRLNRFKAFIQGETAKKERESYETYQKQIDLIEDLDIWKDNDDTLLRELKEDSDHLEATFRKFLQAAEARKKSVLKACEDGQWKNLTELMDNPVESINNLCDQLESWAKALEEAEDPEVLKKLQSELKELTAKKWVSERKALISEEINRQILLNRYENAISETNTRPITMMSIQLTDKYVTEELKNRFIEHLNLIYGHELNVSLEKKEGEKGVTYYYLKLKDCLVPRAEVSEIISEGEFHAVAIAAFLAEISLSPTKSGIVFDDPVSSLDHLIREKVAAQLVDIAKDRQVIVFTHDLFFLVSLCEIAEKEKITIHDQLVMKEYCGAGVCYAEAPWEALRTTKRINNLNRLLDTAEKVYKKDGTMAYEPLTTQVCQKMRQTVERAIEEILLLDIVQRYRRNIYAQKVRNLEKIRKEDCMLLDGLMTEYSKFLHDQAEEARVPLPTPEKLRGDIKKLSEWVTEYNKR